MRHLIHNNERRSEHMNEPRGLMAGELVVFAEPDILQSTIWQVLPYVLGPCPRPRYQKSDEYSSHGVRRLVRCQCVVGGSIMVVHDENNERSTAVLGVKTFRMTSRLGLFFGRFSQGNRVAILPREYLRPFV